MKALLTTIIAICAFTLACSAQTSWSTTSPNIYNLNTGNVGIGNTAPASKLTVFDSLNMIQIRIGGSPKRLLNPSVRFTGRAHDSVTNRNADIQLDADSGVFNIYAPGNSSPTFKAINIAMGGKVGVATNKPGTAFDVRASSTTNGIRILNSGTLGTASGGGLLAANSSATPSASAQQLGVVGFGGISSGTTYKYSSQVAGYSSESWGGGTFGSYLTFSTVTNGGTTPAERMRIDNAGNVSIGTTDPQGYKLAVNGNAIAVSMTVKLHANWPDYVFKAAYQLPQLSDVKAYIDNNHHLQGMPSAADIEKNGVNLGEINAALLKKVEELTLYAIHQQQQIKALNDKLEQAKKLEDRVKALEQKLEPANPATAAKH